ncbi:MAG: hypothetical protein JO312_24575 [Hyphomicrobiales bacterium]|nr:hypothetical protein [Hyphomicrobiales bacterium]
MLASLRNYGAEGKRHAEPGSIAIKQNGGNLANFIFFTMNGRTYAFAYNHETEKIELRDRTQSSWRFTASTIRHQSPRSKLSSGTYKTMGQLASVRLQPGPGGVRRRFHRRLRSSLMFHLLSAPEGPAGRRGRQFGQDSTISCQSLALVLYLFFSSATENAPCPIPPKPPEPSAATARLRRETRRGEGRPSARRGSWVSSIAACRSPRSLRKSA